MKILLVGVPGAGKSTLGKHLSNKKLVTHEPSGERKKAIIRELGIRKHLCEFNNAESLLINALYFERLDTDIEKVLEQDWTASPWLVDTHASYPLPDGSFVNLLPNCIWPHAVIRLEAKPKVIAQRRIDRGRDKDSVDVNLIDLELQVEEEYTSRFIKKKNLPSLTIDNTDDWQYDWVERFLRECNTYYRR